VLAQSPKYTGLYDPASGVRFRHGRAEVTEEQALKLAERRFTDGILIDGVPAKHWARDRARAEQDETTEPSVDSAPEDAPDKSSGRGARKAR
jgi:hypothetical protein